MRETVENASCSELSYVHPCETYEVGAAKLRIPPRSAQCNRVTLSAIRFVTCACGSSQARCSKRTTCTSTKSSNTGRSWIRRIVQSWAAHRLAASAAAVLLSPRRDRLQREPPAGPTLLMPPRGHPIPPPRCPTGTYNQIRAWPVHICSLDNQKLTGPAVSHSLT